MWAECRGWETPRRTSDNLLGCPISLQMGGEGAALRLDCAAEAVRTKIQRLCEPKDELTAQVLCRLA